MKLAFQLLMLTIIVLCVNGRHGRRRGTAAARQRSYKNLLALVNKMKATSLATNGAFDKYMDLARQFIELVQSQTGTTPAAQLPKTPEELRAMIARYDEFDDVAKIIVNSPFQTTGHYQVSGSNATNSPHLLAFLSKIRVTAQPTGVISLTAAFYQSALELISTTNKEQVQEMNNLLGQRPDLKTQLESKLSERANLQAMVDQKLQSAPAPTPATATPGVPTPGVPSMGPSVGGDPNQATPPPSPGLLSPPASMFGGENPQQQQTPSRNPNVPALFGDMVANMNGGGLGIMPDVTGLQNTSPAPPAYSPNP